MSAEAESGDSSLPASGVAAVAVPTTSPPVESGDQALPACGTASVEIQLDRLKRKMELEAESARLAEEATAATCDEFAVTVRKMHRVLVRLGHVDDDRVVQLKGRAAAEVDASDEILVAELMFSGFFNDLSPAAIAALCSCLVAADMETVKNPPATHMDLQAPLAVLHAAATQMARVLTEAGIPTDEIEYKGKIDGGMVNMVRDTTFSAHGATRHNITTKPLPPPPLDMSIGRNPT
jgi:ATP-dependent RNA helicase DOB1